MLIHKYAKLTKLTAKLTANLAHFYTFLRYVTVSHAEIVNLVCAWSEAWSGLRKSANRWYQSITGAVLTIPVTYTEHKRELMLKAATQAGFVAEEVTLLEEPLAAALYYSAQSNLSEGEILLVYDLGGGTFDTALLQKKGNRFEYLALPAGIERCGGVDFDRAIYTDLIRQHPELHDILQGDRDDKAALTARVTIGEMCIDLKHQLSDNEEAELSIVVPGTGSYIEYSLTRPNFNQMITSAIQETITCCQQMLQRANISYEQISRILLVGGSCRIPYVQQILQQTFERQIVAASDLELVLCQGSALYAELRRRNEPKLEKQVAQLFDFALEETRHSNALENLHIELRLARERLNQPMRVAVVGLISAGKSTMMNALLGETLVATGAIESTFNVNWLKYARSPSLILHFKDGRSPEIRSLEDLGRFTHRSDEQRDYLFSIEYLEVYYPNEILRTMNLIDTPGLTSFYREDSGETIEFLNLYGQESARTTQQEAANADAILYLFSPNIAESDISLVEMLQDPILSQLSAINSIGVLTKADIFWPDRDDALAGGGEIIDRLLDDQPQLRSLFYSLVPVCGLLAWGAQTLTDEEFAILQELTGLPEELFEKIIRDIRRFTGREYPDVSISPASCLLLSKRLGQYGTWQAYRILRSGTNTKQALTEALLERSGLSQLKDLVLSHFGNRAYLIKLDTAFRQIDKACFQARQRDSLQGSDREILKRVEVAFEQLYDQEQSFNELSVLRDYYQGNLPFTEDEVQHLLQVTGERGFSDRQRLGLPDSEGDLTETDLREMLKRAREYAVYWRKRLIDPGTNHKASRAASVMRNAYEHIIYRIIEVMKRHGLSTSV